jgi:hypothetical protein
MSIETAKTTALSHNTVAMALSNASDEVYALTIMEKSTMDELGYMPPASITIGANSVVTLRNFLNGMLFDGNRVSDALALLEEYKDMELSAGTILELKSRNYPMKVLHDGRFYSCPVCGDIFLYDAIESEMKFCLKCGQRLSWEQEVIDGKQEE